MAKTRRSRKIMKYTRKSRWASNIVDIGPNTFSLSTPSDWNSTEYTLITNPDYSNQLTSNLYTIKNVEVAINFDTQTYANSRAIENLQFYIMYAPQSIAVGQDYAIKHPEYIMAMRYYGEPGLDNNESAMNGGVFVKGPLRIKTRLSRKLNTGDRIILFIRAANTTTSTTVNAQYGGICRWWTKAN